MIRSECPSKTSLPVTATPSGARKERQQLVFGEQGVEDTLQAVKHYIRAAFGVVSLEASQIADAD